MSLSSISNFEEDAFCYLIANLDPRTDRDTLWRVLGAFGTIIQLEIKLDQVSKAAIIFNSQPSEHLFTQKIYIMDRLVAVHPLPISEYIADFSRAIPASRLSLGGLETPRLFIEEWSTDQYVAFDLNLNDQYIDIFFQHVDGYYRLRIVYDDNLRDNVILQRHDSKTSLTLSGKYPAYFWKSKLPMEELGDTYHLTDWERVTEIPLDEFSRDMIRQKAAAAKGPILPGGQHPNHNMKLSMWTVRAIGGHQPPWAEQILVRSSTKTIDFERQMADMAFEVQFMMEHAFRLKILREYNVDLDFFEKMRELPPQVSCVFLTLLSAPQQRVYTPDTMINYIYRLCKDQIGFQIPIPDDCTWTRRVLVTPTSVYPTQPTVEPMTHVQYHFREHADRFLYVQFTDEDLNPIAPQEDEEETSQNAKLFDRIYTILRRGLRIAGRTYEFLGTSIQDLRAHGCWFFAPTPQSLTPRLMHLEINGQDIEEVEDYTYNQHIFTTDCGKMSPQIAREVAKQLDLDYTPSVIKFNLNGARGILLLSNFLTKRRIQLRSSQIRFESTQLFLEVIKYAKPNKLYLDEKSILLLTSLGVKNYIFNELLDENMDYCEKYPNVDMMDVHYSNGRMDHFRQILDCKFQDKHDPFITNLVSSYQNHVLGYLQQCRLYIHQGVKVFAAMDETGTLQPGEVFLQITDPSGLAANRKVIEGPVVIYRDSSCFPGDVRVMAAINYAELRHYTNVLIFSSIDRCDLPSLCSNDDPDEDNVNVIWDTRLLPVECNVATRSYQTAMTPHQSRKISFREAAKFFTTYISRDMSRKLYEAFIAMADRHKDGVFNGDCIYLSLQMSRALDFAKTGMYATINNDLIQYPYPDFMRQRPLKTYTSSTPVGSIYRTTKSMYERPLSNTHCYYDTRLYVQDMYKYILEARKMKAKYDHSLRILLGQYSVKTEIEFISGHITGWPKYLNEQYRPQFLERIKAAYIRFRKYWKHVFDSQWANDTNGQPSSNAEDRSAEIEAKAAAWYYVTYHPSEFKSDTVYNKTLQRYMSFPWVVESYLIYIAHKNDSRPNLAEYSQPIPAEKIEHHARLHRGPQAEIIFAESDDESDEEESDTDDEDPPRNHQYTNSYGLDLPRHPQEMDHREDVDEVPVVTVKLADLLNLK
ncbi:RNA-dependent RNA polymerase RdRP [Mucor lusitanicus CBS 277.49]|uniref:RNA-dependent RNA polymerase n=1 Tax=Mucor lusitanicus CBS 277.49 TaxID=747725 RepID=A0A168QHG5_MUCCL|nr:RNA-dependent RNA polymerase RdRP [Mucor lusitanicus CBS 277.49]